MNQKKTYNFRQIRRSCITGKVIWYYQGMSRNAANVAYHRACEREIERVKHWPEIVARRKARLMVIFNRFMAAIPITAELTPQQKAAARKMKKLAEEEPECDMEFYNHVMEERRRREEDRRIRKQMREREAAERAAKLCESRL